MQTRWRAWLLSAAAPSRSVFHSRELCTACRRQSFTRTGGFQDSFAGSRPTPTLEDTMEPSYEVVWPRSPRGVQARRVANRLEGADGCHPLQGKRIAFLWDFLFRGDELFPVVERELTERFAGLEVVGYQEFGNTHGSDEVETIAGLPTALANHRIDAVVSGMGC